MSVHADHDERWAGLVAGYALDALEEGAAAEVTRHLAECDRCSERLRWYVPAVNVLAEGVPQHAPSPELRARLLETVRAEATPTSEPDPAPRRRAGLGNWARGLLPRPALALGLTLLVAVFALGAGWMLRGGAEESQAVAVRSLAPGVDVTASLVLHDDHAVLSARGLPTISTDEVFQVWLNDGSGVTASSVFVAARGSEARTVIPGSLEGVDSVLVTREPAGGSVQPTTSPLLRSDL